jgi:hypothetical protein
MARFAIIRTTLVSARLLGRSVATRMGYPVAGTRVGGGRHVEDPQDGGAFRTRRWRRMFKHPTLARWALLREAPVDAVLTAPEIAETVDLVVDSPGWASADEDGGSD